jgi:hypothetical protein
MAKMIVSHVTRHMIHSNEDELITHMYRPAGDQMSSPLSDLAANMSDYAAVNAKLVNFVPELASEYAKYPMKRDRWLDPKETGPKHEQLFIAASWNTDQKSDYVYGRGPY